MDRVDLELFDLKIQKYLVSMCLDRKRMVFEELRMDDSGLKCPEGYECIKVLTQQKRGAFLRDQGAINKHGEIIRKKIDGEWSIPFLFETLDDLIEQWERWCSRKRYGEMKRLEGYEEMP